MADEQASVGARDIVVVAASAGGAESLIAFVRALDSDLPATILVVLHVPASGASALPRILGRVGKMPVDVAAPRQQLQSGRILIAPPGPHLVVVNNQLRTSHGLRENGHRPAVDVLFRSAARACGPRVIAVILSGSLDDGTAGAIAVRERGGLVLAQDPAEAAYPSMPQSVIEHVEVAETASAGQLGAVVNKLCGTTVQLTEKDLVPASTEAELSRTLDISPLAEERPGQPAGFGCPECHGTLFSATRRSTKCEYDWMLRFRFRPRCGHRQH